MVENVTASDAQVTGIRRAELLKVISHLPDTMAFNNASRMLRVSRHAHTSSRNSNPISESAEPPPTDSSKQPSRRHHQSDPSEPLMSVPDSAAIPSFDSVIDVELRNLYQADCQPSPPESYILKRYNIVPSSQLTEGVDVGSEVGAGIGTTVGAGIGTSVCAEIGTGVGATVGTGERLGASVLEQPPERPSYA